MDARRREVLRLAALATLAGCAPVQPLVVGAEHRVRTGDLRLGKATSNHRTESGAPNGLVLAIESHRQPGRYRVKRTLTIAVAGTGLPLRSSAGLQRLP